MNAATRPDLPVNELLDILLDETLSYSSALFAVDRTGTPIASADRLPAAQRRKFERILDLAAVGPGGRVLQVGTDGGGLALAAALRGAFVHVVTRSAARAELVRARAHAAGVDDQIRVERAGVRQIRPAYPDGYDSIVSIQGLRLESVDAVDELLAPDGRVVLQCARTGAGPPASFAVRDAGSLTVHYVQTLRLWRERLHARWRRAVALGYPDAVRDEWLSHLDQVDDDIAAGRLDLRHLVLWRDQGVAGAQPRP